MALPSPQQATTLALLFTLASFISPADAGAWGVSIKVYNMCYKTIDVTFSTGDRRTISPGGNAWVMLCDSYCTGFLGSCETYTWSYSATPTDDEWEGEWSQVRSGQEKKLPSQ